MGLFKYLGSLSRNNSGDSSKSFAIVMQSITSFIVTVFMCCILSYDAYVNGYIKTDLESLAVFIMCVYAGVPVSGVPKILGERNEKNREDLKKKDEETVE